MNEEIGVPENCENVECHAKVSALIYTSADKWVGLCLRHMTILVLSSTADSMES
jgi:hypothetical protein